MVTRRGLEWRRLRTVIDKRRDRTDELQGTGCLSHSRTTGGSGSQRSVVSRSVESALIGNQFEKQILSPPPLIYLLNQNFCRWGRILTSLLADSEARKLEALKFYILLAVEKDHCSLPCHSGFEFTFLGLFKIFMKTIFLVFPRGYTEHLLHWLL